MAEPAAGPASASTAIAGTSKRPRRGSWGTVMWTSRRGRRGDAVSVPGSAPTVTRKSLHAERAQAVADVLAGQRVDAGAHQRGEGGEGDDAAGDAVQDDQPEDGEDDRESDQRPGVLALGHAVSVSDARATRQPTQVLELRPPLSGAPGRRYNCGVDHLVGSIVAGHRVQRVLGRGGMGVVYEATDIELERAVALKVVAPEL